MSKQITLTLPDKVYAALAAAGETLEETAAEFAKRQLVTAYTEVQGIALNLRPVATAPDPNQTELPLGEAGNPLT